MFTICSPALIYIVFSLTQIIIDIYYSLYNTAFLKFVVALLVTLLLNGLCKQGLGVVSWIIVFIPFILMTFVVAMLLYIFGLNAAKGVVDSNTNTNTTSNTNITSNTNTTPYTEIPNSSSSPEYESFI